MFNIGCYVTSRYSSYNEFSEYMDGCIEKFLPFGKPSALVTGDYKSTNSGNGLVAKYAFEHNIPLRRFATMWGKHNPTKPGKRNNAGVASNAQIIKNSNGCVLFWTPTSVAKWDFMSGGCRSFLRMCDAGHLARPLIKIKVDIYKPDIDAPTEKIPQEVEGIGGDIQQGSGAEIDIGALGGGGGGFAGGASAPSTGGGMPTPPTDMPTDGGGAGADASGGVPLENGEELPTDGSTEGSADGMDAVGNIDVGGNAPNTAGSIISNIPIDTNGDGNPDAEVNAVDTDMNGTPDAIVKPVDSDGNGTIDKLELEPIPTAGQIISANRQQQSQPQPQTVPAAPTTAASSPQAIPPQSDEEKKNSVQPMQ